LDLTALRVVASAPAQFAAAVEQIAIQRSQGVVVIPDVMDCLDSLGRVRRGSRCAHEIR
jgi:hypothetical protein